MSTTHAKISQIIPVNICTHYPPAMRRHPAFNDRGSLQVTVRFRTATICVPEALPFQTSELSSPGFSLVRWSRRPSVAPCGGRLFCAGPFAEKVAGNERDRSGAPTLCVADIQEAEPLAPFPRRRTNWHLCDRDLSTSSQTLQTSHEPGAIAGEREIRCQARA